MLWQAVPPSRATRGPRLVAAELNLRVRLATAPQCHVVIKAARAQYEAWRAIVERSQWKTPEDVKKAHPKASILKSGRVVFNIKANDYRLIALVQYAAGILMIRFFGSHEEYDKVDAERV